MIDNLIGSLNFTAKLPINVSPQDNKIVFPDLSPVSINNLLVDSNASQKPFDFEQELRKLEASTSHKNALKDSYFINRYEYDRFINSDKDNNSFFDWKKNPVFKDPRYFDNEDLNSKNQSEFRQFVNGSSKLLPSALNAFVNGLDPRLGVGAKDNSFNQWISDWNKELEQTHPNYYSKEQSNSTMKGLIPFTEGSGNFWGDKVLKNAGFTLGAIGSAVVWDAAITASTEGLGVLPATYLAIGRTITLLERQFSTAQKLIRVGEGSVLLGNTIKKSKLVFEGFKDLSTGQKALNYAKLGYINYVGSNAEASIEGYQGLVDLNQKFIDKFIQDNGREPNSLEYSEMKKISKEMANTRYGINLPLLMITNAIQFGTLFSPSKVLRTGAFEFGEKVGIDATGQLLKRSWKDFSKLEKVGKVLGNEAVKDFLAEGFQEGAQYSIEKATEDFGFKKYKNPSIRLGLSDYMESQALGIKKTFEDQEGRESMFIGGLTGLLTAGGSTAWDKFVSKKSQKEDALLGETIDKYNSIDATDILNSEQFKEYIKLTSERDQVNFDGTSTHLLLDAQMERAIKDKNPFAFKALQHEKLFNLVSMATKLSKVDALKLKIDQLKDLSVEEFAVQLGIDNLDDKSSIILSQNLKDYIDVLQDNVQNMSNIIKQVDNTFLNTHKDPKKYEAFQSLKDTFAFQLSHIEDIKGRMSDEMEDILSSKFNPLSQEMLNNLMGQSSNEDSLILDDFTKNFVTDTGFDLGILNNKYAKAYTQQFNQLSSDVSNLNLQIETAKLMKLPSQGYQSKLDEKKKQLKDFTKFLTEFNVKINKFGETITLRKEMLHPEVIDAFKDLTSQVVKFEMNKDLSNPISITKADELVNAIADLHLLNSSLDLFIDKNNKFQTEKGQSDYINEYLKWKTQIQNRVQDAVRQSKYETLRRTPEESISELATEISSNIAQIENINNRIEAIDKLLTDDNTENKEDLLKEKENLIKQREELHNQNKELEDTKKIIEKDPEEKLTIEQQIQKLEDELATIEDDSNPRIKEIDLEISKLEGTLEKTSKKITLNPKNEFESELANRLEDLVDNYTDTLASEITFKENKLIIKEKINKVKQELVKTNLEIISNNDLLIYLNNKLEFYLQKIVEKQKLIDNKLKFTIPVKNSKNTKKKKERYEDLITKHKDLLLVAQDIQNRINEVENINKIQKQVVEDLAKKVQYYQSILNTEKTNTLELQQKLTTTKENLEKTNKLIEKTESYIDKLKSLLKSIFNSIKERISLLSEFLIGQNKNTEEFKNNNLKLRNNLIYEGKLISKDLLGEYEKLEKEVNDVLDHEEINSELLDKAELLLETQIDKAIKLQNEIRYLGELFQENLNEIKKENVSPIAPQNKKIIEEVIKPIAVEETPIEVIPVTPTVIEPIIETVVQDDLVFVVENEEGSTYLGNSVLLASFYDKTKEITFAKVMHESFQNFLGQFKQKQDLNTWLSKNEVKFVVQLTPDELFGKGYFDLVYKNKPRSLVVILVDKENKPIQVNGEYVASLLPDANKGKPLSNNLMDVGTFNREKKSSDEVREKALKGEIIPVEVYDSKPGKYNFLGDRQEHLVTTEDAQFLEVYIPTKQPDLVIPGYTLMPGKLNFLVRDTEGKVIMPLAAKLSKLKNIVIEGKPLITTIHDSLMKVFTTEESNENRKSLKQFLDTILYLNRNIKINSNNYLIEVKSGSFSISNNGTKVIEYTKDKQSSEKELSAVLSQMDLNDRILSDSFELRFPNLTEKGLNFKNSIPYKDFIIKFGKPIVGYQLDFKKPNPFKRVKAEMYFKPLATLDSVFGITNQPTIEETSTNEQKSSLPKAQTSTQSDIETKKADIEKTKYGTLSGSIPLSEALPNGVYIDLEDGLFAYVDKNKKIAAIVDRDNNYVVSKSFWNDKTGWQLPNKANLKDDVKRLGVDEATYIKKYQDAVDSLDAKYNAELDALEEKSEFFPDIELTDLNTTSNMKEVKDNSTLVKDIVEPKKEKKKFNKDDNGFKLNSSTKLPIIQSTLVSQTDIDKVRAIFGNNVNIQNLSNIANSDAWATFTQSAITLFRGATRVDLYHEAWHHFSQLYLTKEEKIKLYNETRDRVKNLKDKSDLEVEEYTAREFSKFTETGKIEGKFPERKSIFQKIMDFLKKVFSKEKDLSFDTLFNQLYTGKVNPLSYSTDNLMFGKLNSGINDNFTFDEAKTIEYGLDALFVQFLREYEVSLSQKHRINDLNNVYKGIKNHLIDKYEESENQVVTDNLEKLIENFEAVKEYHLNNSVIFKGVSDNYTQNENGEIVLKDSEEDDKKGRNSADFQETSEKSVFDIMDKEVKSLIFTLVDKDSEGNEILDTQFGLPKLVDFPLYVNLLTNAFADKTTFKELSTEMIRLSKDYKPMKDLLDLLTINESKEALQLKNKFIHLAMTKRAISVNLYMDDLGIILPQLATSNKKTAVENNLKTYFYIAPTTKDSLFQKVNEENAITKPISYNGTIGYADKTKFLSNLGIDTSFINFMTPEQVKKFYEDLRLNYAVNHLNAYLEKNKVIKDIYKALATDIDGKSQTSFFKSLIKAHLDFNPVNITGAKLNADGKIENELVLAATIDKDFNALLSAKSIQELMLNPNKAFYQGFFNSDQYLDLKNSKLLSFLFNSDGTRNSNTITRLNSNGLDTTEEENSGLKTKDIFFKEKMVSDINQFINGNILTTMQLSNKATHLGFQFSKILIRTEDDFYNTLNGYLLDELKIIQEFDRGNTELTKLEKLSEAIKTGDTYNLAIFRDILSVNLTKQVIVEYLKDSTISPELQIKIEEEIKDYFRKDLSILATTLGETNLKKIKKNQSKESEILSTTPIDLIEDYNRNQFVFNVELSKVVFGNPYMHKDPFKRIAGATSSGVSILSDKESLEDFNKVTNITQRSQILDHLIKDRLGLAKIEFKNQRNTGDELRFNVFKDKIVKADLYDNALKEIEDLKKGLDINSLEYKNLLQKEKAIKNSYENVNGSDAMGAITMDGWRRVNWLAGRWSPELENMYDKSVQWDYFNRLYKHSKTKQEEDINFAKREEFKLTAEEITAIAVLKYQYYGNVKNSAIMEKAFHKYQLMPLIPQLIDGKFWEHHLDRMILEDVDYSIFESADKLEKEKKRDDFYNKNESVDTLEDFKNLYENGETSYNIKTGYLENLKEQVFMENGESSNLLFGTQVRALLFNTGSFSDLYDEFRDIIGSLTEIEKQDLFSKSGMNELGEISDNNKFIKFLLDEIDKKVVNSNVKEYLRLTQEGNLAHSLDTGIQRQSIESIVNSVIQNKLVKQKMHGEMMVQVSNVGFEDFHRPNGLKFYGIKKEVDSNGIVTKSVRSMEVKIPLSGKFKNLLNLIHSDGRRIETRERLNEMIREGKIDKRSITMVGYRIPTQEHNSVEIMEVQEFLDPISNLIVVPYEITAKAGSDFDIDKLNIFKPHINSRGEYVEEVSQDKIKELEEELKDMEDVLEEFKSDLDSDKNNLDKLSSEYVELDNFIRILKTSDENLLEEDKLFKDSLYIDEKDRKQILRSYIEEIKNVKTLQEKLAITYKINKDFVNSYYSIKEDSKSFKSGKQNRIIEIFNKVLLDPNNFLSLITPNDTFMFDEGIDDVFKIKFKNNFIVKKGKNMPKDVKYTKSLIPRHNNAIFKILMEAGKGLGVAAVGNKFSQLIQKSKVNFTQDYLDKFKLLFPIEDISSRSLQDGQSKATAYSQLINLLVDVANDPRVGYVNMGDKVIPIVNLMINLGTPIKDIVFFINQPIVVDFVAWSASNERSIINNKKAPTNNFKNYLEVFNKNVGIEDISKYDKSTLVEVIDKLQEEGVDFVVDKENMKYRVDQGGLKSHEDIAKGQLLILTQYLQLEEIASDFLRLQMTMNFDTRLVKDGFEAFDKTAQFEEIKKEGIFTNLDYLMNKTVIAPLNSLNLIVEINKTLMPLVNNEVVYSFMKSKLESDFKFKNSNTKSKFSRTFKNDFITFLFQNFIGKTEQSLELFNNKFASVLKVDNQDFTSKPNEFGMYLIKNLFKQFGKLKSENPEIFKKDLLNRLFVTSEEDFKNIGLSYFNKDKDLQDSFINQFKELLNSENLEVRNFMLKFAYMSFYQSGLNKSFFSSADIIPVDVISPLLEKVRNEYLNDANSDEKKKAVLSVYYEEFMKNNNTFRKKGETKSSLNKLGVASNRIKDYVVNIDKVLNDQVTFKEEQNVQEEGELFIYKGKEYKITKDSKVFDKNNNRLYPFVEDRILTKFKNKNVNPTEEQKIIIEDIVSFAKETMKDTTDVLNPENALMISGAGGTGKTFTISRAIESLLENSNLRVVFAAPTHNAKRELQSSLNDVFGKGDKIASTNASLFGLDYDPISGKSSLRNFKEGFEPPYYFADVIVLDEYSMLGGQLWDLIGQRLKQRKEAGLGVPKIIYTGDYAQIPSPGERKLFMDGEVTNLVYHNHKDRVKMLYTNMRAKYADLAIVNDRLRKYVDRINDSFIYKVNNETIEAIKKDLTQEFLMDKVDSNNVKYYNEFNKSEWLDSYLDSYNKFAKDNLKFGVIVNYNNSSHINNLKMTDFIRKNLFNSDKKFNEGELLIIDNNTLNYIDNEGKPNIIGKDERALITKVEDSIFTKSFEFVNKGIRGRKQFSIAMPSYKLTIKTGDGTFGTIYVPKIEGTLLEKYRKEDFDFLNMSGDKPSNSKQIIALISQQLAEVSYGYVVNSHKVQGSSYDQVWVWESNIMTAKDLKELIQLDYTAYSRAKYKVHSYNDKAKIDSTEQFLSIDENTNQEVDNNQEITQEDIKKLPPLNCN